MLKSDRIRINIFLATFFIVFSLIGYRLFVLSYYEHVRYAKIAEAQIEHINNIIVRGNIYFTDKDGERTLAATNKKFPVAVLVPARIEPERTQETADVLANIAGAKAEAITKIIATRADVERIVSKKLTSEQVATLEALNIKGVSVAYQTDRYYPGGTIGADVLGFLGYNGGDERSGQYGIEAYYDAELAGVANRGDVPNKQASFLDRMSSLWGGGTSPAASEGLQPHDIVLTIDKNVQAVAEDALENVLKRWSAAGGSVIVEDPKTGRILAMADRPSFDPNTYGTFEQQSFLNATVQHVFEPGSSFKPITMAAGLDLRKVTPETTYTDTGTVTSDGRTIRNFDEKAHGVQTMARVLEKSLNTGAVFVEGLVGDDHFLNYVINMGFGQKTGIDLPGELSGDISNLYSGRKINYLTAAFGQGIAVTALQLVNAFAAIANGGRLMRPYIVDRVITEGGQEVVTKPEMVGTPLSERTSATLKEMLVGVVDRGFDKARIKGYDVAGKTGTAQIADGKGGYLENEFIHDFVGFAPASDPRFVILIKMDKPQGVTFAADSLSPVFREIASFLLTYYTIPPTRKY